MRVVLNKRFRDYLREKEFGENAKWRFKTVLRLIMGFKPGMFYLPVLNVFFPTLT